MTVTKYKTKSGIRYKVKFNHDRTVHLKKGLATRQEAKEWEAAERDRIYTGGMRSNQTITIAEYLEWWHSSFVWSPTEQKFSRNAQKRKMGRSNYIRNRQHINKIASVIGHIKVCKLTPRLVYKREEQFLKSEKNPKGLAPSTIRKMQFMLKGALEDGVKEKQLASNPLSGMDALTVPKVPKKERVMVFQDYEVDIILATADELYADDRRWYLWALLTVWTGMRKGEMAGLQWGDITGRKISVERAVDWSLGETKPELKLPKTDAGTRNIPLANVVVDALKAYRAWQGEIFLKAGRPMTDQTHVFFNDGNFGILHKSVSQHRWEKLLKTAGLEHRSMHKNRHTFSSRAIRGGIRPELLTEVMGHSEKRTTMEIYGHQFEEAFEENMKVIDAIEAGLVRK